MRMRTGIASMHRLLCLIGDCRNFRIITRSQIREYRLQLLFPELLQFFHLKGFAMEREFIDFRSHSDQPRICRHVRFFRSFNQESASVLRK